MSESLSTKKQYFLDTFNQAKASNVGLYKSDGVEFYWVGYAGMGSTEARRLRPDLEEAAAYLLSESSLVPSGRTTSIPIDIDEPIHQYQQLSEIVSKNKPKA